jgi:DNA-binding NtrC family response regulator
VPSLRERPKTFVPLVSHFTRLYAQRNGIRPADSPSAPAPVCGPTPWPGNVRELENEIARIMEIIDDGETVSDHHLLPSLRKTTARTETEAGQRNAGTGYRSRVDSAERGSCCALLRENGGNKMRTARAVGLSYQGFLKKAQAPRFTGARAERGGEKGATTAGLRLLGLCLSSGPSNRGYSLRHCVRELWQQ